MNLSDFCTENGYINMQIYNSSGTWTNPGNYHKIGIFLIGGGGGGGGHSPDNSGGGGGGYLMVADYLVDSSNVVVVIGAGGVPSAGTAISGAGGTSSVNGGIWYLECTGGIGGSGNSSYNDNDIQIGGTATGAIQVYNGASGRSPMRDGERTAHLDGNGGDGDSHGSTAQGGGGGGGVGNGGNGSWGSTSTGIVGGNGGTGAGGGGAYRYVDGGHGGNGQCIIFW